MFRRGEPLISLVPPTDLYSEFGGELLKGNPLSRLYLTFTLRVYGHVLPGMDEELAESSASILNRDSLKTLSRIPQNGVGEKARNVVPKVGVEPTRDLTPNGF